MQSQENPVQNATLSWQPELVYVPPGDFWMGSTKRDRASSKIERPFHRLYLPGYWIGRYPVTRGQYEYFLSANPDLPTPKYWRGQIDQLHDSNHPVRWVTWREALAYCAWLGKMTGLPCTLPSEAEWEKAARGPDGRIYPWGNKWGIDRANTIEYHRRQPKQPDGKSASHTTLVGLFSPQGDSPYSCADMSSNVLEWTRSLFIPYPYRPNDGRLLGQPGRAGWPAYLRRPRRGVYPQSQR